MGNSSGSADDGEYEDEMDLLEEEEDEYKEEEVLPQDPASSESRTANESNHVIDDTLAPRSDDHNHSHDEIGGHSDADNGQLNPENAVVDSFSQVKDLNHVLPPRPVLDIAMIEETTNAMSGGGAPEPEEPMVMTTTTTQKRPATPHSSSSRGRDSAVSSSRQHPSASHDSLDLGPNTTTRDDASTTTSMTDGSVIARTAGSNTPRSLWSQLLGGNESSDSDDGRARADDDDESDVRSVSNHPDTSGMKLLGEHLARVKLEFEEQAHQYRTQIKKLEQDKLDQQQALREANDVALQLREQVKTLELQNTRKWQIESRDNWLKQIESLRLERNRLKQENERMGESLAALSGGGSGFSFNADDVKRQLGKVLEDLKQERSENERLKQELQESLSRAERAEATSRALKKKLDLELELKWERQKHDAQFENDAEGRGSILGMIGEVVAPRLA